MLTINEIKSLMQPMNNQAYKHNALLDPTNGKHALSIALIRWLSNAKPLTLTQLELPPDSVGRIYIIDIYTGKVVGVKYAEWSKGVHKNTTRSDKSANNHKKGNYLTIPHITLTNLATGKNEHFRPGMHLIIAYAYKPLREQYAQAVLADMMAHNRSFYEVEVEVNHINKDTLNNSAYNLEVITASANAKHRSLTTKGNPLSMLCHYKIAPRDLSEYYNSCITDNTSYVERMCLQLSASDLPVNTGEIMVGVKSITGNKVKTVDVTDLSIWAILNALYTAKAHHICLNEMAYAILRD
jgi:hypothetical protein